MIMRVSNPLTIVAHLLVCLGTSLIHEFSHSIKHASSISQLVGINFFGMNAPMQNHSVVRTQ